MVARTFADPRYASFFSASFHVLAVGKAASAMAAAVAQSPVRPTRTLAIGTHRVPDMPPDTEWHESAHPVPDTRSVAAAERALQFAAGVASDETLVLLLSGGASSLMALPSEGVSLTLKQQVIRRMLSRGADIHALNTVRKHLSRIKGGRLAAACSGTTVTFAVSDVMGDDLSVIGSGPAVADSTTISDARTAVGQFAPEFVDIPFTKSPEPGDPALQRSFAHVVASKDQALAGAAQAAASLGYRVLALPGDVSGEARKAAQEWLTLAAARADGHSLPACVLSAGETTVRVTGSGRGGRNQEFALALVDRVAAMGGEVIVASVGTDGIDGPTDAAGALVDATTRRRAVELGLDPQAFLAHNNAYEFFANLGDLIHLGRTDTNVGDVQVLLRR